MKPAQRRELAGWFHVTFQIDIRRACGLAHLSRTAWYRRPSEARLQTVLRLRIRELAHARPRFGYLRIWVLLRREGWRVNRKRVRRLYRLEGLQLRMRVRRRKHIAASGDPHIQSGQQKNIHHHGNHEPAHNHDRERPLRIGADSAR